MGLIIFPIHFTLQVINLAIWATLAVTFGLLKFITPNALCRPIDAVLKVIVARFGTCSVAMIKFFNNIDVEYKINGVLDPNGWYLVISNHISYLDIILLIAFTHKRIPTPKFFLKQELIWLPFVGVAAWALEMPFMKRYSQAYIKKHPHLKGKDIETTKKHCEKYRHAPTTIINFVEGTRVTPAKKAAKGNQLQHLLPPKAGGIAFTFAAMGELFQNILDVTLIYPGNKGVVMRDMLSGNLKQIVFVVDVLPVSPELIGDYFNDEEFRIGFQNNLNQRWQQKDAKINAILEELNA